MKKYYVQMFYGKMGEECDNLAFYRYISGVMITSYIPTIAFQQIELWKTLIFGTEDEIKQIEAENEGGTYTAICIINGKKFYSNCKLNKKGE